MSMNWGAIGATSRGTGRVAVASVAAVACVVSFAATDSAAAAAAERGAFGALPDQAERTLREHPLRLLDGRTLTLGSLRGEVVVVNLWASWCAPCRSELPRLGGMQSQLAGAARVVAVSIDEDADNARRFCRTRGVSLQVACDGPEGLARALDVRHVPLTLVLDRAGRIAYTTYGSDARALAGVEAAARRLAAEAAPSADAAAGESR
jgi:thiol-disulfide isomerase/thioredoxin